MTDPNWIGIPGVEAYEQRVLIASNPGDLIVLSSPVDDSYFKYLHQFLEIEPFEIVVARGQGSSLIQRLVSNKEQVECLRSLVQEKGSDFMDTFVISEQEMNLSKKLSVPLLGSSELSRYMGSKSGFRQLAGQTDVMIPPGYENLKSEKEIIKAAEKLFQKGFSQIVVKGDWGASAVQNRVFDRRGDWQQRILEFIRKAGMFSATVEAWLDSDVKGSYTVRYFLNSKVVTRPGPWQQMLQGENKAYCGVSYPASVSKKLEERINLVGRKLANHYHECGYRGDLGFDLISLKNDDVLGIECNARKGGAYYPRRFAKKKGVFESQKVIFAYDFYDPEIKGRSFKWLWEKADFGSSLLFGQNQKKGLVFYNAGLLKVGKIQVVAIADDFEEIQSMKNSLKERIRD